MSRIWVFSLIALVMVILSASLPACGISDPVMTFPGLIRRAWEKA